MMMSFRGMLCAEKSLFSWLQSPERIPHFVRNDKQKNFFCGPVSRFGPAGAPSLMLHKDGVLARTDGGNVRIVLNIVGVLLVLLGSIWVLQGINVLPGSFMSGQMRWAVRGGILIFAGIAGLLWANRKRQRTA